ncbi:hypothetical protein [Streptomyces sp. NPDC059063]|uniref:hypothetical protein n=1 Tax=unclassified Streptomyces TaxID=2593676 RepID=UPI0036B4FA30
MKNRLRHALPFCVAAGVLLVGCAEGEKADAEEKKGARQEAGPRPAARAWEPDDALQRAARALDAYADDGTEPALVESAADFVADGMDSRTFKGAGNRPYRLDITCDTDGIGEVTLTLGRGDVEQPYGIGCGDREGDQFNIPAGEPFTVRVDPVKDGTGLVLWRLNTITPDEVDGCDDDINGCDG